jgi:hypothetical protein
MGEAKRRGSFEQRKEAAVALEVERLKNLPPRTRWRDLTPRQRSAMLKLQGLAAMAAASGVGVPTLAKGKDKLPEL